MRALQPVRARRGSPVWLARVHREDQGKIPGIGRNNDSPYRRAQDGRAKIVNSAAMMQLPAVMILNAELA